MHPERDLVVAVAAAGHDQGQVVEDSLAEAVHEGEAMRSRQIDARLPFLGAAIGKRLRRNPELHGHPPCCRPHIASAKRSDWLLVVPSIVAQFEKVVIAGL